MVPPVSGVLRSSRRKRRSGPAAPGEMCHAPPMSQNQIESAKENINFLSRTMLAYIAGAYLLAGAVGNYLVVWFEKGEFDTVSIIAAVCLGH